MCGRCWNGALEGESEKERDEREKMEAVTTIAGTSAAVSSNFG
jgi:hypothetical protein